MNLQLLAGSGLRAACSHGHDLSDAACARLAGIPAATSGVWIDRIGSGLHVELRLRRGPVRWDVWRSSDGEPPAAGPSAMPSAGYAAGASLYLTQTAPVSEHTGEIYKLSRVDARTRRILAARRFAGPLDDLLLAGGSLWATTGASNTMLWRLDPRSLAVRSRASVPTSRFAEGIVGSLAAAGGGLGSARASSIGCRLRADASSGWSPCRFGSGAGCRRPDGAILVASRLRTSRPSRAAQPSKRPGALATNDSTQRFAAQPGRRRRRWSLD